MAITADSIFHRRSVHGMFVFVVLALAATSFILMKLIETVGAIEDLQGSPYYATRRQLLQELSGASNRNIDIKIMH